MNSRTSYYVIFELLSFKRTQMSDKMRFEEQRDRTHHVDESAKNNSCDPVLFIPLLNSMFMEILYNSKNTRCLRCVQTQFGNSSFKMVFMVLKGQKPIIFIDK